MKLARFSIDAWESYGLVEGDRVRVIQGSIFGEHTVTEASYPLGQVKLLPPTRPTAAYGCGTGGTRSTSSTPLNRPSWTITAWNTTSADRAGTAPP